MNETIASIFLIAAGLYLLIGFIFYIPFIWKGVHTFDDGVASAPFFMKVLIFPGTIALWPLMLAKWRNAKKS